MRSFVICNPRHITFRLSNQLYKWVGSCSRYGANNHVYRVLVVEPGGKGPLGRPRRIWKNNITILRKIYVRETE
jgi:hypothetical protein